MSGALDIRVQIGGQDIPVTQFEASSGSYGSVGSASLRTSISEMAAIGTDMVDLAGSATLVPVTIYVGGTQIFDGDLLEMEWDMETDSIIVHARDHAAVFVDQKRILTRDANAVTAAIGPLSPGQKDNPTGISTMNRKVSQVVADIAEQFGYTPRINMGDGTDVMVGSQWGSGDHVYMSIPQSLWMVLNTLARDTGNEIYTTPKRELVFGPPGDGLDTLNFVWNVGFDPTTGDPTAHPCGDLKIDHKPRRNGTFRVLVFSYSPGTATATIGRATVIGDNQSSDSIKQGIYGGDDAKKADSQLLSAAKTKGTGTSSDLSHVQLYTFHWDGSPTADANARAVAIATDIAKRLMLLSCYVDIIPSLTPTQPFIVGGPLPTQFSGNTWYATSFRHRFTMPGSGRGHRDGLITQIQALDLPSAALGGTVR
jgi:hypothetical protein